MNNLGFIGCGNMAKAIISGILKANILSPDKITVFDPNITQFEPNSEFYGVNIATTNQQLIDGVDTVILAIKPNMVEKVLSPLNIKNKAIGSIVAGLTAATIDSIIPENRILRIMPNTCATIGKSYTCFHKETNLKSHELMFLTNIFTALGIVKTIEEKQFLAATSLCSCGVAYGHMLIDSMANGGVYCGVSKKESIEMAAFAVLGACEMILKSDESPLSLKDKICSPGGMTIEAMKTLEDGGFNATVMEAIISAYKKGLQ